MADDDVFEQLRALGVFDPAAVDAGSRRALIEYLLEIGATIDDLVEYRDELPVAASMITSRPAGARITLREVAERAGTDVESVVELWGVLGLPPAGPDDLVAHESTIDLVGSFLVANALMGESTGRHIARIIGEMQARLADMLVTSFILAMGAAAIDRDPTMLALAQENARVSELLPAFVYALEVLLRHHLELARRMTPTVGYRGGIATYETRRIAVGFADLTGSTALAARVDFTDLAAALEAFEQLATDVVHRYGGRVVKLIGDEVMFSAGDANAACAIANDLVDEASTRPELPPLRVGIAVGDVLNRAGDCFGPVVNLAARLVDRAEPDTVLLPAAAAAELDPARFESSGGTTMELRGFDDPVPVTRVYRARR